MNVDHQLAPHIAAVVRAEILSVGASMRREFIVLATLVVAATALAGIAIARTGMGLQGAAFHIAPEEIGFALAWLGLVAPLAVWKHDAPSERSYTWSLPMSRTRVQLCRVFSGWVWLTVALSAVICWAAAIAWLSDGVLGFNESRWVFVDGVVDPALSDSDTLRVGAGGLDPTSIHKTQWSTPAWQWTVPFVAATVMYMIGTTACVLSNHPWRWLIASIFALGLLTIFSRAMGITNGLESKMVFGEFGFNTLVSGGNETRIAVHTTTGVIRAWLDLPDLRHWLSSVVIWGLPSLGAMLAATSRFQEK